MKQFIAVILTFVSLKTFADGEPWKASLHVTTKVQCGTGDLAYKPILINEDFTVGMVRNIGTTWVTHENHVYPVTTLVSIWYEGAHGYAAEVETIIGEGAKSTVALKGTLSRVHSLKDFYPLKMSNVVGIANEAECLVESTVNPSANNY
jgi:hypothetical protein